MLEESTGNSREQESQAVPSATQLALDLIDPQAVMNTVADGYEKIREATSVVGEKYIAISVQRELSYKPKVSDGINRVDGRHAHFDWLVVLLMNPATAAIMVPWICAVARYRAEKIVDHTDSQELKAYKRALAKRGVTRDEVEKEVAAELGTDVLSLRRR